MRRSRDLIRSMGMQMLVLKRTGLRIRPSIGRVPLSGGLYSLNNQTHRDLSQNHDLEGFLSLHRGRGAAAPRLPEMKSSPYKANDIPLTMTVTLPL